jgi:hypothetical protein
MIEKAVLNQRAANMTAAQGGYIEKQKKAIAKAVSGSAGEPSDTQACPPPFSG